MYFSPRSTWCSFSFFFSFFSLRLRVVGRFFVAHVACIPPPSIRCCVDSFPLCGRSRLSGLAPTSRSIDVPCRCAVQIQREKTIVLLSALPAARGGQRTDSIETRKVATHTQTKKQKHMARQTRQSRVLDRRRCAVSHVGARTCCHGDASPHALTRHPHRRHRCRRQSWQSAAGSRAQRARACSRASRLHTARFE